MILAIALTLATITPQPGPGPGLEPALHMALATQWNTAKQANTPPPRTPHPPKPTPPPTKATPPPPNNHLATIRQCESGNNYQATDPTGTYRGAYQFDRQTWQSVGGTGDPATAPPTEQDARAQTLYNQRGTQPWPNCGR